jgi:hypothetical protein
MWLPSFFLARTLATSLPWFLSFFLTRNLATPFALVASPKLGLRQKISTKENNRRWKTFRHVQILDVCVENCLLPCFLEFPINDLWFHNPNYPQNHVLWINTMHSVEGEEAWVFWHIQWQVNELNDWWISILCFITSILKISHKGLNNYLSTTSSHNSFYGSHCSCLYIL